MDLPRASWTDFWYLLNGLLNDLEVQNKPWIGDHCPILLRSKYIDWGPKPFKILDCWFHDRSFKTIVQDCWASNQQWGWGGFVLKEKIKEVKED